MDKVTSNAFSPQSALSRRGFLAAAGGTLAMAGLAACSAGSSSGGSATGGGSGGQVLKFWDMPWGKPAYSTFVQKMVSGYKSANGDTATYQTVQWASGVETFAAAIASQTGPSVSTGYAFQPYTYADQGAIAYADNVIAALKKNGMYDDFLPGTIDAFKTAKGYVALPWNVDVRVIWYRKSALDKAGVTPPTTWDEWVTATKALAKHGIASFGISGANGSAQQQMESLLINNGGGFWDQDGNLDCTYERNVEAVEFLLELRAAGGLPPNASTNTVADLDNAWKAGKVGIGYFTTALDTIIGDSSGDLVMMSPVAGRHGDKATLMYVNPLMMYTESPSQQSSEDFVLWYLQNLHQLWENNLVSASPPMKSIAALPAFAKHVQQAKCVTEWIPIAKTAGARSGEISAKHAKIEGSQPLNDFCTRILEGSVTAKSGLATLQGQLESLISS